jgi:8-oxo-dGTP pyrophosphatase MutT (NUDIX family)
VARVGGLSEVLQHRLPVPVVRVCYRIAYRLAKVYWYVVRPDVHGVKGVLRDGDRVLLVRHTYGDRQRWDIPGGHAHTGEPPAAAVRREMEEELGIAASWVHLGSLPAETDHKHENVHVFVTQRRPHHELVLARGEIAEAQWFALDALPGPVGDLSLRALALLRSA